MSVRSLAFCVAFGLGVVVCSGAARSAWAQSAASIPQQFDTVDVAALALGLSIEEWKTEVGVRPSSALIDVVHLRPAALLIMDSGQVWYMDLAPKDQLEAIPTDKYPLGPGDLKTIEAMLQHRYLAEWIKCMRDAWNGQAGPECVQHLARMAGAAGSAEQRELLLANIGSRLVSLGDRNATWSSIMYDKKRDPAIEDALVAFQAFEAAKVSGAYAFKATEANPTATSVTFVNAGWVTEGESECEWTDFTYSEAFESRKVKGPLQRRIAGWTIDENGQAVRIRDSKSFPSADLLTFVLSPDQHVILKGKVDAEQMAELKSVDSMEELISLPNKWGCDVFLTRPGFAEVGVVAKE